MAVGKRKFGEVVDDKDKSIVGDERSFIWKKAIRSRGLCVPNDGKGCLK